jgi:hypothetical protein
MQSSKRLVVAELQAEIEALARLAGPDLALPQLALQRLKPILQESVKVDPRPILLGRTAYERFWVVVNRLVRRVAGLGVEPGVAAQNDFNAGIERALEQMIRVDAALHAEVVHLRAESKHDRV